MSLDKRSVSTDALDTLGFIHTKEEGRDAIHLGVEPVVAAERLKPGEHVGFVDGGVGACDNPVGIVDPFLKGTVKPGEKFWLVVYPRQITSLRHVWTHPAFENKQDKNVDEVQKSSISELPPETVNVIEQLKARKWITEYAAGLDLSYNELIDAAKDYLKHNDYLVRGGDFEGEYLPDIFWTHYEIVTGETVPESDRGSFFSCSC